jgi:hypothetical protein
MLKSVTLICTYILCCSAVFAQQINIIPQPLSVITKKDKFTITSATKLVVKDKKDHATASFLNKYLEEYYGIKLKQVTTDAARVMRIPMSMNFREPQNPVQGHFIKESNHD